MTAFHWPRMRFGFATNLAWLRKPSHTQSDCMKALEEAYQLAPARPSQGVRQSWGSRQGYALYKKERLCLG